MDLRSVGRHHYSQHHGLEDQQISLFPKFPRIDPQACLRHSLDSARIVLQCYVGSTLSLYRTSGELPSDGTEARDSEEKRANALRSACSVLLLGETVHVPHYYVCS